MLTPITPLRWIQVLTEVFFAFKLHLMITLQALLRRRRQGVTFTIQSANNMSSEPKILVTYPSYNRTKLTQCF